MPHARIQDRRTTRVALPIVAAAWLAAMPLAGPLPGQNPIVVENQNPGVPSAVWYVPHPGDANIQGFATDISVNRGETVRFKILTDATAYHIDVYRLGWYQGLGARLVGTGVVTATLPQSQPAPLDDPITGLTDCGNWAESAHWDVPANAVSGIHQAKLTRDDGTPGTSVITFVVRDDASTSDLLFQTSDSTWQAYNVYGGMSLYPAINGGPPGFNHATKVSYNRPFDIRHADGSPGDDVFAAEYAMVRFLEANGYDVTYTSSVDSDRRGNLIQQHGVFLSVGHDEYWSGPQRANVTAARDAGVHLAFFSGNEVYWRVRYEPSIDGTNTSHRTLVCYKEGTLGENGCGTKCDPSTEWTGLWRDGCAPTYSVSDACAPENSLTGQIGWDGTIGAIQVPHAYKDLRFWRNTGVASLSPGQTATLGAQSLGSEWDWEQFGAFYPPRRIKLSQTLLNGRTHHLTLYRADSGALVFGAGTIQWSWGLDAFHTFAQVPTNADMQQATINLFADMGIAAGSLQPGLVPATGSSDTQAPASILSSPADGATTPLNQAVLLQGIASDVGGGVVAGVEVSVDGGTTWRAATGTTTWSYLWAPTDLGPVTIKCRAFDDTANLEPAGSVGSMNVITMTVTAPMCPCTAFPASLAPVNAAANDGQPIEVGMKFRVDADGYITALRYYRPAGSSGTRVGNLWTTTGLLLAQQSFTADTGSGWQEIPLSAAVPVFAGTNYVVSYFSPSGDYVATLGYFTQETGPGPVHGLADGAAGGNGLYLYTAASSFPTQTFQASNYFADVVFDTSFVDTTPPTVTARTPVPNATGVPFAATVTATFSEPIDVTTLSAATFELRDGSSALVAASLTYDAPSRTATLTPSSFLAPSSTYTATVRGGAAAPRILDLAGNALAADVVWSFTTALAPAPSYTVFEPTAAPASPLGNDQSPIEVGMRFRTDVDGFVTALRYYKPVGASGTHTGSLWTNGGTNLAQAVFTGETASGWQQVALSSPIAVTAGTTYVVSYHSASGDYVGDNGTFTQQVGNNLVHGLADGVAGPNGVYLYAPTPTFPNQTFLSSNYWADVVFQPTVADVTPPSVTAHTPAAGAVDVPTNTPVTVTFDEALDLGTIGGATLELRDGANALVPASVTWSGASLTATLTPAAFLAPTTTYTVTVRGGAAPPRVEDASDNPLAADVVWSFTTGAYPLGPFTVFTPSAGPAGPGSNDGTPIELGMKFRTDVDGVVTALRYYKRAGATGTRTGSLWTSTGTLLGREVFTGESASGWQEVALTAPVPVLAGTTYVVSYFSSSGDYVSTLQGLQTTVGTGLVHGLADGTDGGNGLFLYTGSPTLPTQSFQASNYWADVVFDRRHTLTATSAGNGSVARVPDLLTYAHGSSVDVTATADPGYVFAGWTGDATGTTNPLSLTMDASKSVVASFAPVPPSYTLTVQTVGSGSVAQSPDLPSYGQGTLVQLTATPAPGFAFIGWSGNASGTANPLLVTMNADTSVTATFTLLTYTLGVATVGSGSVAVDPDLPSHPHGSIVQLTATPAPGYAFAGWSGDASGTTNPTTVLMDGDKNVTATFTPLQYTVRITTVGSGSVAVDPDLPSHPHGSTVQLTATPAPGFAFTGWSGDASGTTNPTTVLMDGDKHVTATFTLLSYTLSVATVGSGSVAVDPDLPSHPHGSTVQLTATPAPGFAFTGWSGDASGTANPTTVLMDGDKHATATFTSSAGHEVYGSGCYDIDQASFYQLFPTAAAASAGLTGQSMVLTPNGSGYAVSWGSAVYQPPSGLAVTLPASDDGETSFQPSIPMPVPGGSAATLFVHSNGFVSTGSGNGALLGTAAPGSAFLDAPDTAFWSWHDFDPTEPGSGPIQREEVVVGPHTVLCITWNGVESRAAPETANPSTVQFQFELDTGVVRLVWPAVTAIGTNLDPLHPESTLVGFSPGGPSADPGSIVLTTTLPLQTALVSALGLTAEPAPQILGSGSSNPMVWTIHDIPDAAPPQGIRFAILYFGFSASPPIDLGAFDAPGCDLLLGSLDVPFAVLTGNNASPSQPVPLVFPPPLLPGMQFFSQAFGLFPPLGLPNGENALGLVTSNGVKTTF